MPEKDESLKREIFFQKLRKVDIRRRLEKSLHRIFGISFLGEDICSMQKVLSVGRKLEGFASCKINDEGILKCLDLQVVIIVEEAKNTPTNLYFQHFYTLLLKDDESLLGYGITLLLSALLLDDIFYCSNVIARKLSLEYFFLQLDQVRVGQVSTHISI